MLTPGDKAYLEKIFVTKRYLKKNFVTKSYLKEELANYPTKDEMKLAFFEQSTDIAQEFARMREEFLTKKEFMVAFSLIMDEFKAIRKELAHMNALLQAHTRQIQKLETIN